MESITPAADLPQTTLRPCALTLLSPALIPLCLCPEAPGVDVVAAATAAQGPACVSGVTICLEPAVRDECQCSAGSLQPGAHREEQAGTWHMARGTWRMAHGTWLMTRGTWVSPQHSAWLLSALTAHPHSVNTKARVLQSNIYASKKHFT